MKYRNIIKVVLVTILYLSCGAISAQNKMLNQEKYIDKMVATYKNNNSYRHISVLGCNLGNTYAVFCENLKKKGFKLVKTYNDYWEGLNHDRSFSWQGKLSGRDVGLQIDCCGKYIVRIWMDIACKSEEDENITYRNVLGSLNNKYGKYNRKTQTSKYWEKANVCIDLHTASVGLVKGKGHVLITYNDLIYQNWINEYDNRIKNQKIKQDRKAFDNNL